MTSIAAPANKYLIIWPAPQSRDLSAAGERASSYHRQQRGNAVRLGGRLVGADSADPGEAHRQPRFVACAGVDRIERDFEHQRLLDLAHRAEALDRVAAHPAVDPFQLLVGEPEIGLADG